MKIKINPNDKYFIFENGKHKQVLYNAWDTWLNENRKNLETVLYFVDDGVVANFFFYGKVNTTQYDDDGRPLLWCINEFDMSYTEYQEIYDKGIRVEGVDLPEIIKVRKELESGDESYEGLDSFSMFATQEEAIEYLVQSYGDWRSRVIVSEPNILPPFELNI